MKYQVNEVLGLASCHAERKENRRYVQLAKLDIPPDCIALLDTVCNLVPCPPAVKQMQKHPYDSKGDTHTHTRLPGGRQDFKLQTKAPTGSNEPKTGFDRSGHLVPCRNGWLL